MSHSKFKFNVFVSYSRKNENEADQLCKFLCERLIKKTINSLMEFYLTTFCFSYPLLLFNSLKEIIFATNLLMKVLIH